MQERGEAGRAGQGGLTIDSLKGRLDDVLGNCLVDGGGLSLTGEDVV